MLDRYAGHDEDIISRLRHLLYRAREIRSLIHKAGAVPPGPSPIQPPPGPAPRLGGTRLLVVDFDEAIRRSAHHLLGCQGASVETAHDAHEAIALMRQTAYSAALVDIRLPDLDGYEAFKRLREVQPNVPDHPDDRLRLGPDPLDRQGAAGRAFRRCCTSRSGPIA